MAADIGTTLASWSSTAASNQPDNSDAVGPNTLADNLRTVQSVVRDAVAGDGTIVSAATTDLSTVNASYINVTGSTGPITALGTLSAGIVKILKFASTPTLTHNATSLILPGAANITAVAGDTAMFRSEGAGNWRCIYYQKTNGILTISAAKTLTVTNTLTLSGTDGTVMTFPTTSATIARTDAANTFTGLQTFSTGITSTAATNSFGAITLSGTVTGSGSPAHAGMGSWSGTTGTFSSTVNLHGGIGSAGALTIDKTGSSANRMQIFVGDGTGGTVADDNYIANLNTTFHIWGGALGTTSLFTIDSSTAVFGIGIQVGSPTGGSKGSGTANFASDIYKNNTAYTNPDYVFEHWATGQIVQFADKEGAAEYLGLRPLAEIETLARISYHLPGFGQTAGHGLFGGSDRLLAATEEAYLYLFDHEARLKALEAKLN